MNHLQKSNNKKEKLRGVFFQMGLIIACGLTFLAFEWTTSYSIPEIDYVAVIDDDDMELPPTTFSKPIEKPEVRTEKITHTFKIVKTLPDPTPDPDPTPEPDPEPLKFDPGAWAPAPKTVDPDPAPFIIVEEMPEFVGGEEALFKYLGDNIKYPEVDLQNDVTGTVYLRFVVGKKGDIKNIEVLRGVSPTIDKEAVRVLKNMPNWKPGKQRGKNVRVAYNLPISFKSK